MLGRMGLEGNQKNRKHNRVPSKRMAQPVASQFKAKVGNPQG